MVDPVTPPDAASESAPVTVAEFDVAATADAAAELMPCCASKSWIAALVAGRPFRTLRTLTAASDRALAQLDWPGVDEALSAHPRIGDRAVAAASDEGADLETRWSRAEQAGAAATSAVVRSKLHANNVAYEEKFGHVFLICASGLSAEDMLSALLSRLHNDPVAERQVVRTELTKIVRLRLAKAFR